MKTLRERTDELVNTIADEKCCDVCQCENGKKIHCACHRKQILTFIEKERALVLEERNQEISKYLVFVKSASKLFNGEQVVRDLQEFLKR